MAEHASATSSATTTTAAAAPSALSPASASPSAAGNLASPRLRTRPDGRSPSRTGGGQGLIRRQPTQERLNDILQLGRTRAESMGTPLSSPSGRSPRLQPLLRSESTAATAIDERDENDYDDDGDNEPVAGPTMRLPSSHIDRAPSYQSTATTTTATGRTAGQQQHQGPRARKRSPQPAQQHPSNSQSNSAGGGAGRSRRGSSGAGASSSSSSKRWLGKALAPFRSIELENKGSVARDHLALERTFLAWLRTSLAFASIGIAITQLFRLNRSLNQSENGGGSDPSASSSAGTVAKLGKPLGAAFLGISILVLFLGYHRYVQSQHWVIKGKFPASRGTVMAVSFVTLAVTVVSLVVVIVVQSDSTGKS